MRLHLKNGSYIELSAPHLGEGGEARVYSVLQSTYPRVREKCVAKIFHDAHTGGKSQRTPERLAKLELLCQHKPPNAAVAWPLDILYENQKFVGYLMPQGQGEKLEYLCGLQLPKQAAWQTQEWQRFERNKPDALRRRLQLCFNLAAAVDSIHKLGNYILADLKPDNILVTDKGIVTIVDIDSMALHTPRGQFISGNVATEEYAPPEYHKGVNPQVPTISQTWDYFSLAVIFYRLLLGLHPFAGSAKAPYDRLNGLADLIQHGFFAQSPSRKQYLAATPPPHQLFHQLDKPIQDLFIRCFERGHEAPHYRPSPAEWCTVLAALLSGTAQAPFTQPNPARALPTYTFSTASSFPINAPNFPPKISFISPPQKQTGIVSLFISAFSPKKSNREIHITELENAQQNLQVLYELQDNFRTKYKSLKQKFEQLQNEILANEREEYEKICNQYHLEILKFEQQIKELDYHQFGIEAQLSANILQTYAEGCAKCQKDYEKKYNQTKITYEKAKEQLEAQAQKEIAPLQNRLSQIKANYHAEKNRLYADLTQQEKIKKQKIETEIQQKIDAIERQRLLLAQTSTIGRNIYVEDELKKHTIKDNIRSIFTDRYISEDNIQTILRSMNAAKILTAADFDTCDATGRLGLQNKNFQKIQLIAKVRAESLVQWRMKLALQIQQNLPPYQPNPNQSAESAVIQMQQLNQQLIILPKDKEKLLNHLQVYIEEERKSYQEKISMLEAQTTYEANKLNEIIELAEIKQKSDIQALTELYKKEQAKLLLTLEEQKKALLQVRNTELANIEKQKEKLQKMLPEKRAQLHAQITQQQKALENALANLKQTTETRLADVKHSLQPEFDNYQNGLRAYLDNVALLSTQVTQLQALFN